MKKIIFATALLVAFSVASFAGEKDVDTKLLTDLITTLKNSKQVHWTNKATYSKAAFSFNDKTASAFYDAVDNELIGFGIQLANTDLPEVVSDGIKNKYGEWALAEAMTFIDVNGNINYFVKIEKNNRSIALKVTPNGDAHILCRMPSLKN